MSGLLLIRHAACESLGARLNGRTPGVRLTPAGRVEAECLAARLASDPIVLILASPRERCQETADAIATVAKARIETLDEVDEVDFGAWTGRNFADLAADPEWTRWNVERSRACAPQGESMSDVQRRMRQALRLASTRANSGAVALVTHAEPIRAALAEILGLPLDLWARLEISPASVSRLDAAATRVLSVNETFG